jgi:ATP-dependent Zn protease
MAGFEKDSGWQSDLEQARKISEQAISTWGLTDEALSLPVKDGKVILNHPKVQKEIAKLVEEGREECDRLLRERWVEVRILSIVLLQRGHLERADLEKLLARARSLAPLKLAALKERVERNPSGGLPPRWNCMRGLLGLARPRS